jgi:hypothetical protein
LPSSAHAGDVSRTLLRGQGSAEPGDLVGTLRDGDAGALKVVADGLVAATEVLGEEEISSIGAQYGGMLASSVLRLDGPTTSTPHVKALGVKVRPTSVA